MSIINFEVGKTYLSDNFTATITRRTPKYIFFSLGKTDDFGFLADDYKCKISVDVDVEKFTLLNYFAQNKHLVFFANAPVAVEEDDVTPDVVPVEENVNYERELSGSTSRLKAFRLDFESNKKVDDTPCVVKNLYVPDALTAINLIEQSLDAFIIDSNVKIDNGVFARNSLGDELNFFDSHIVVTVKRDGWNVITNFWFDIPESKFIAELRKQTVDAAADIQDLPFFTITADNGNFYIYSERSLELIQTVYPDSAVVEKPVTHTSNLIVDTDNLSGSIKNFVARNRRTIQYKYLNGKINGKKRVA